MLKTQDIQCSFKSVVGPLFLVASENGLKGVFFQRQNIPLVKKLKMQTSQEKILAQAVNELKEYFAGQRKKFDVTLDFNGTDFQQKVWRSLRKIPYGKTVAYRDIARDVKNPKAVRAVGSANGKNPLCIIVPCHRVISSDGSIGGYSGGLAIKRKLLALEGVKIPKKFDF